MLVNMKALSVLNVKQLVEDLKEQDLVIKIEEHMHSVGHSERSGAVVEPYLSHNGLLK